MIQQTFIRSTLMTLFCVMSLSLQGCDDLKRRWQSHKAKSVQDSTAIECPKDSCNQEFAVLPADADDPTSVFLAKVRKQYPNAVALYAGVYEPKGNDITLDIPYIDKPVILYLGSYRAVKWKINPLADTDNPKKKTKVVAVVYGAYDKGTEIQGVAKNQTFNTRGRLGSYRTKSDCTCAGGNFHCSGTDVFQAMGRLQHRYGIQVINFATDYSNDRLSFINMDTPINFAQQATKKYNEQQEQKQRCVARTHPNYENTYQQPQKQQSEKATQNTMTFYGNNSSYQIHTGLNGSHIEATQDFENHLYKFPITNSTWGDYLNPKRKVPDVGYMA